MRSLSLSMEVRQQTTLSPRLQRAVRLLQMSSIDFVRELRETLERNPFLEVDDDEGAKPSHEVACGVEGVDRGSDGNELAPRVDEISAASVDAFAEHNDAAGDKSDPDGLSGDYDIGEPGDIWQGAVQTGSRRTYEGGAGLMDMQADERTLADHLIGQLAVLPLSPRDMAIATAVVGSLDEDGYLRFPLPDLADALRLDSPPSMAEMKIALSCVQSLDPAGVGARSVAECLLLQLPEMTVRDDRERAEEIIRHHLPRLAARDVPGLARVLGCAPSAVESTLAAIRHLEPRPGWRFASHPIQYINPDVIVRKAGGKWSTTLNSAIVPKIRLNHVYAEMFQRHRNAQHGALAAHLHEARWTVSNVEQRFATILSVAQAIVDRQRQFLEFGPLAMKPLCLREIADAVGVHESTVSRVSNNKFMSTPLGVFELKFFFSRAIATTSGGQCSATAIRGLMRDMIAAESPQAPLSDAEIARLLAQQGLVVARRTVTKYRQLLRIEAFEKRRKHA